MDKIFVKSADFVQREVAGELLLIPLKRQLTDINSLYVLNETGAALWRLIDGKHTVQDIIQDLSGEYAVTLEQLTKDLDALIEDLLSIKAIQEAPP
ncbi:MAG: hypothetical protein A3H49_03345 [Nitrospirae bacterium RIFCSPLOWO2_02_FULL_62_14]|nr:MAG: hypothetical protein A3H49_03345 [Nitrospirae bacterium RIFCSPLOWO2_02_FULL_62_14]